MEPGSEARESASGGARTLDLTQFVDARGFTRFQWRMLILCGMVVLFDGLDFFVMSYASPYITEALKLTPGQSGFMFAMGNLGQVIGGLSFSFWADKAGRRPVIVGCVIVCAVLTALTGFATNLEMLVALRFADGIVIGGLLPVTWALISESVPTHLRATSVALVMFGYSLGSGVAGPLTQATAPHHGWPAVFFAAGAGTLVLAALIALFLFESPRFLANRHAVRRAPLDKLLATIDPGYEPADYHDFILGEVDARPASAGFRWLDLFAGRLRTITPLIWFIYFTSAVAMFMAASWGPTFMEKMGIARSVTANTGLIGSILGATTSIVLLRLTEKRGPAAIMILPLLAMIPQAVLGLGLVQGLVLLVVAITANVLFASSHASIIAISSIHYPSAIRANAAGWASAVSKIGAVIGPLIGGWILGGFGKPNPAYFFMALCGAIIVCGLLALHRQVSRPTA